MAAASGGGSRTMVLVHRDRRLFLVRRARPTKKRREGSGRLGSPVDLQVGL